MIDCFCRGMGYILDWEESFMWVSGKEVSDMGWVSKFIGIGVIRVRLSIICIMGDGLMGSVRVKVILLCVSFVIFIIV